MRPANASAALHLVERRRRDGRRLRHQLLVGIGQPVLDRGGTADGLARRKEDRGRDDAHNTSLTETS